MTSEMNASPDPIESLALSLIRSMQQHASIAVAYSGGVDSAVVCAAAYRAIGESAVAITGVGPAVAQSEIIEAREVARAIGIRHVELQTDEILDPNYIRNDERRCYYCKSNLYSALRAWASANGVATLMSGTNADDLGDYRPGLQAGQEHHVFAPLADLNINKERVRQLAKWFSLSVAEKVATPCLASRVAYGESVTPDRLRRIESAERYLKSIGFLDVRARAHHDELLRLELNLCDLQRACEPELRHSIHEFMSKLGFKFITLDIAGRQTGSLNRALPILQ